MRTLSTVVLVLLLAGILTFSITVRPVKAQSTVAIGADAEDTMKYPNQRKLAATSDGHLHTAYHRKDGGGIFQIYHAESNDAGETWTEEQVTYASVDQRYPALAVDSQDGLHMVWQDNPWTIRYDRKAGAWQGAEFVASYATVPAIAIDGNDEVNVVYGTYLSKGDGIRWRKKTSSGWQAEKSISGHKTWVTAPAITVDSHNNIHVIWNDAPGYYYDTYYRQIAPSGDLGPEWQLNTETDNEGGGMASIAIDSSNHVHVAWYHLSGGYSTIKYREYTTSWQPTQDLESPTTHAQGYPTIAVDSEDHIHVVWGGQHPGSPVYRQIRHAEYITSWQPIQPLTSSTTNDQTNPMLMWALFPVVSGANTNIPQDYPFVWMDGTTIRYWGSEGSEVSPPNPPEDLAQEQTDGTPLSVGATTYETTVIFKGKVTDPDGSRVRLQVELRRLDEYGGEFNEAAGGFKESDLVESGTEATAYSHGLVVGEYHWRARAVDEDGLWSEWVDFGGNGVSETDLAVALLAGDLVEVFGTGCTLALRNEPGGEVLIRVPDGWVLRIEDTHGDSVEQGGYIWWELEEEILGVSGWAAKEYLRVGDQDELAGRARLLNDIGERRAAFLQAVAHYYFSDESTPSLYASIEQGRGVRLNLVRKKGVPIEVVMAIAGREGAFQYNFDNTIYDQYNAKTKGDYRTAGVGIMQIHGPIFPIPSGNKGWGSDLLNYWAYEAGAYLLDGLYYHDYYGNTLQGIHANVKDGFRVMQYGIQKAPQSEDPLVNVIKVLTAYNIGETYPSDVASRLKQLEEALRGELWRRTGRLGCQVRIHIRPLD